MADDPQATGERREIARLLVQQPLVTKERDPERFRLIRRHEVELDRWFTQRLGYRLHVDGDTARLYKTGYVPDRRPLRTPKGRPFHRREYVLLSLVLAATAAGPDVISLRDLVDQVRSAAAETGIVLTDESVDRRALVSVLTWLIDRGLAVELHARVDAYASDGEADAVLKLRPDRIVLLALPALAGATDAETLLDQAERRSSSRQWMRARLVEDPVLYRRDLTDAEWGELRRRLGDEAAFLDEMFGLRLEARAEGVAAIDPTGTLSERRFPTTGTVGHAALLLIEAIVRDSPAASSTGTAATAGADDRSGDHVGDLVEVPMADVAAAVTDLAAQHASHWSNELVGAPERFTARVVELLVDLRLAEVVDESMTPSPWSSQSSPSSSSSPSPSSSSSSASDPFVDGDDDDDEAPNEQADEPSSLNGSGVDGEPVDSPASTAGGTLRLLPAAARFVAVAPAEDPESEAPQEALW